MKRFYLTIGFIAIMLLSFCAHRRTDTPSYSQAEINLSVRCNIYREALDRRLDELEKHLKDTVKRPRVVAPASLSHESFSVD